MDTEQKKHFYDLLLVMHKLRIAAYPLQTKITVWDDGDGGYSAFMAADKRILPQPWHIAFAASLSADGTLEFTYYD